MKAKEKRVAKIAPSKVQLHLAIALSLLAGVPAQAGKHNNYTISIYMPCSNGQDESPVQFHGRSSESCRDAEKEAFKFYKNKGGKELICQNLGTLSENYRPVAGTKNISGGLCANYPLELFNVRTPSPPKSRQ